MPLSELQAAVWGDNLLCSQCLFLHQCCLAVLPESLGSGLMGPELKPCDFQEGPGAGHLGIPFGF